MHQISFKFKICLCQCLGQGGNFLTVESSLVPVVSRLMETFSKWWVQNECITVFSGSVCCPSVNLDGNTLFHSHASSLKPKSQTSPVGGITFTNKEKTHPKGNVLLHCNRNTSSHSTELNYCLISWEASCRGHRSKIIGEGRVPEVLLSSWQQTEVQFPRNNYYFKNC